MTQTAIQHSLVLETTDCCNCHVVFAIPDYMLANLRRTGRTFYCPNGHSMVFNGGKSKDELEAERLRKMLEEANRSKTELVESNRKAWDAVSTAEKELKKTKAAAKRVQTRIHAGVCPCCNRTFQNLARHMASQHKDFKDEK